MSSPSTNPSSCDSSVSTTLPSTCPIAPSENQEYTNSLNCASPALAQAVPGNVPNLPESSVPRILMTTAMANQAAEDLAHGRARDVFDWYEQYMRRIANEDRERNQQNPPVQQENLNHNANMQENKTEANARTNNVAKIKLEDKPEEGDEASAEDANQLVYETLEAPKKAENPLQRMEMMANSTIFEVSAQIAEVMGENQPKRDRAEKATSDVIIRNSTPGNVPASFAGAPSNQIPFLKQVPPAHFSLYPMPTVPPFMSQENYPKMPVFNGYPYPMAPGQYPPGYQMHMWNMHQRMMAQRAAQAGQMHPMHMDWFSHNYNMHYPMFPGPRTGPSSVPSAVVGKTTFGPMTAPTMMQTSFLSPGNHTNPATTNSDILRPSQPHPTPLYSFNIAPPTQSQLSPLLFQDLSNIAPF